MTVSKINKAAVIGGGVIGGGWLARLIACGIDVKVFDPDPEAARKLGEVITNATAAYDEMFGTDRGAPGSWTLVESVEEAVFDADYIQEAAPERLDLKQDLFTAIDAAAPVESLICSSTSGLLPTELQTKMTKPERLLVAHPFNPVYLLPLVELVGGEKTSSDSIERARALFQSIGMHPLVVRKEIEAFIADRLMEALWREALWLVKDGIATTEEIDDAVRYGCGLRWAQMGTFQTFWLAGGEGGMRHMLEQFGPALKWPWTKLMDVPELTDDFIDTVAGQCDDQADGATPRELEKVRDKNLIGILNVLATNRWGAGNTVDPFAAAVGASRKG